MPATDIVQVPIMSDNFAYLIHDEASGRTAVLDPGEAFPVISQLDALGWDVSMVLLTHHHWDHTDGIEEILARGRVEVVGAASDAPRVAAQTRGVTDGDTVELGETTIRVLAVPGHTTGHLAYHIPDAGAVFTGDCLFSIGCGRMMEGDPAMFWESLSKLRALPDDTQVYCAHEYTLANIAFAKSVDANNPVLLAREAQAQALRNAGEQTVPSMMGDEKAANPFLRADDPALAAAVGLKDAPPADVFAELRRRKDRF